MTRAPVSPNRACTSSGDTEGRPVHAEERLGALAHLVACSNGVHEFLEGSAPQGGAEREEPDQVSEERGRAELPHVEAAEPGLAGQVVAPARHDVPDVVGQCDVVEHPVDVALGRDVAEVRVEAACAAVLGEDAAERFTRYLTGSSA
jgi:hypothetical protein